MSGLIDTLSSAIENHQVLVIRYNGNFETIYPYAYGTHTNGNWILFGFRSYRMDGLLNIPKFTFYNFEKISQLDVTDGLYEVRPLHDFESMLSEIEIMCKNWDQNMDGVSEKFLLPHLLQPSA